MCFHCKIICFNKENLKEKCSEMIICDILFVFDHDINVLNISQILQM